VAVTVRRLIRSREVQPAQTLRSGDDRRGFALRTTTAVTFPDMTTAVAHLHEVLGDSVYESLAHDSEKMTTAEMAAYAYDQIGQTRTELDAVSN
jgi:hypothetical protein